MTLNYGVRLRLQSYLAGLGMRRHTFFFFYPVLRRPTPQSMFDLNVLGSTTHKVHGLPTPHKLYGAQLWFYLGSA